MTGRRCQSQASLLADIELFEELAREDGCWDGPRHFADAHTAVSYFRGTQLHPDTALHQSPGSRVTVMAGLPASGKNTWVERHRNGLPVVSFDDSREELGLAHGRNEGAVAHHAVDKAKELLRRRAPFVWNATHLSAQMRGKAVDLAFAYGATVEIVHLEQPYEVLMQRNARRDTSLCNAAIERMFLKWEVPAPTEAHRVTLVAP
jgi:predicted kinase